MGEGTKATSILSWTGKNHDNPKPYDKAVIHSRGPITHEDLAEYEKKLLPLILEMAVKVSKELIDENKKST